MHKDNKSSSDRQVSTIASRTVGLDVGDRFSHFCELDGDGEIAMQGRVRTTAEAMRSQFGHRPTDARCAGGGSAFGVVATITRRARPRSPRGERARIASDSSK